MTYKAIDVAKHIINYCISVGTPISNLQLQKILYYVQYNFLNKIGILFIEDFEAWKFGPVIPSIYYKFSGCGATPISVHLPESSSFSIDDDKLIKEVVDENRKKNPWKLVEDTHVKGCAWDLTFRDGKGEYDIINSNLIKEKAFPITK